MVRIKHQACEGSKTTKNGLKRTSVWYKESDFKLIQHLIDENKTSAVNISDYIRMAIHDTINYDILMDEKRKEMLKKKKELV